MKKLFSLTLIAMLLSLASYALTPISGTFTICVGDSTALTDSPSTGGVWASSNTAIVTIGSSSGAAYGVSTGVATITFTMGTSYVTQAVTVSPVPAPIVGGTTSFCMGTTTTLTDATPGGTWSTYYGLYATVGSASGIVTGLYGGTEYIYYSMPGGCSVFAIVTVDATPTGYITGPVTVCTGSAITLVDSAVPGGTWISDTPSVATITSGGVVTGVSAGTVTISYATTGICGLAYAFHPITVLSTTDPGIITSSSPIAVGTIGYAWETVWTGAWSSSNPSVATIDASTGQINGISVGTATISYSVTGCGGLAVATDTISVVPLDGISGHVNFGSAIYGNVKVWLITYNSSTHILSAVDSVTTYMGGFYPAGRIYYEFRGLGTDSFRVKAALPDSFSTTGFMPTYHGSYFYWHDADVIWHVAGSSDLNKDIAMAVGTLTAGPGFIAGDVTTGANKGTSGGGPSEHMHMCVLNSTTHQLIGQTYTDAAGHYTFNNLPVGETYYVFPDSSGYLTVPYTSVTLTTANPSMTTAGFQQHTLSFTITPVIEGVHNVTTAESTVYAFPNPSNGNLNVSWNAAATESGTITITDISGRELISTEVRLIEGNGVKQFDMSGYADGLYLVHVKSATIDYNSKVQVQH